MPAIDLARLRRQAARLADFFFLPEEFIKHLHETLDFYVNRTLRKPAAAPPGTRLPAYRTPAVILKQIEMELKPLAEQYPEAALNLADGLWEEGYLETRRLTAFLLGCLPPQEAGLLERLRAWAPGVRDPALQEALMNFGLARLRREAPHTFFDLMAEWLAPAHKRSWANGLRALTFAIADARFTNVPAVLRLIEPILSIAPSPLQVEIEELILVLYEAHPAESIHFLRSILMNASEPSTLATFRRMASAFPPELNQELRALLLSRAA